MPRGAKPTTNGNLDTHQARERFIERIAAGDTNAAALAATGRTATKTIDYWRKDADFKARMDQARMMARANKGTIPAGKDIDFATFSKEYLGQEVFWHQQQWVDFLEGREPAGLHSSQIYEKASPNRLLLNVPPHHGKTTTITVNYVTYRICMDPNVRVKVVSKNEKMAKQFLYGIKARLTHPRYRKLQAAYAPKGRDGQIGWQETADVWSATQLYLGGDDKDSGEKDPTVEALGMGGHVYGARANLIILDDCIVGANAHNWEDQMGWISREVTSRLGRTGKLLVVGTRIAPVDLYRELRNGDHYSSGVSPYTYLQQPAVLEFADDAKDWVTLWPKSNAPIEEGSDSEEPLEDGMYAAWDGPALSDIRSSKSSSDWALVYMQADVAEEATFPEYAVKGCIRGERHIGPLKAGAMGHPARGQDGMFVVGSIDPSGSGDTAVIVYAVDRDTKKRYVLTCTTMTPWSWPKMEALIKDWTETFSINEWVIEKNMYHASLKHSEEIKTYLASKGVRIHEHFTGAQKLDINLGVASLAPLFGQWHKPLGRNWEPDGEALIELPSLWKGEQVKKLVEQLVTWAPDTKNKTDLVLALWFAELRAREVLSARSAGRMNHLPNKYLTPNQQRRQTVISLSDFQRAV